VNWELEKSKELEKPVMGVYLLNHWLVSQIPSELRNQKVVSWNIPAIVRTMKEIVSVQAIVNAMKPL